MLEECLCDATPAHPWSTPAGGRIGRRRLSRRVPLGCRDDGTVALAGRRTRAFQGLRKRHHSRVRCRSLHRGGPYVRIRSGTPSSRSRSRQRRILRQRSAGARHRSISRSPDLPQAAKQGRGRSAQRGGSCGSRRSGRLSRRRRRVDAELPRVTSRVPAEDGLRHGLRGRAHLRPRRSLATHLHGDQSITGEGDTAEPDQGDLQRPHSSTVVRRDRIVSAGFFDESPQWRRGQDFEMWFRLAKLGATIGYQERVLAKYRERRGNLSGSDVDRSMRDLWSLMGIKAKFEFTPTEQAALTERIAETTATCQVELGKTQLLQGQFDAARTNFAAANRYRRGLKLLVVGCLLAFAPGAVQRVLRRRSAPRRGPAWRRAGHTRIRARSKPEIRSLTNASHEVAKAPATSATASMLPRVRRA